MSCSWRAERKETWIHSDVFRKSKRGKRKEEKCPFRNYKKKQFLVGFSELLAGLIAFLYKFPPPFDQLSVH